MNLPVKAMGFYPHHLLGSVGALAAFSLAILLPLPAMARTTDSHLNPYTFGAMNNNAKATVKDVEGKLESALGELTGDPDHQVKGKVKQVHASAMKTAETLKEGAQSVAQKMDNTTHELAE